MKQFISGILLVLLAVLLLPHTEAAAVRGVFADPAHPGKCVMTPNFILNPGQIAQYPAMTCARIICGDNSHAQIHTCGVDAAPAGCRLGEQKFPYADYPTCCPREIICI
ncbi:hypothetical protein KR215_001897 [Drosophila sulfurigaster]|nr:hypothetical protein KR215_001897 [Drosophila sulfurigaster]